jgi:hypothetical protein
MFNCLESRDKCRRLRWIWNVLFPQSVTRGAHLSKRKYLPCFRVKELSHLLSRGIETSVRSQEMLANRNCIKRQVLRQTVAPVASSPSLCDERRTADGSEYSYGCLPVLQEPLAELLHCRNFWLSYSITGTSGWVTPLHETLAELLHYMNLWLNYSIAGTSGWVTPLHEPLVELLHNRNLWLSYSITRTYGWVTSLQEPLVELLHKRNLWMSYSITGTSAWVTPLQEPLAELLHYGNLWLSYSITGTSGWVTPLQEALAELLHYGNFWLSYSITGTSGWVTPLQEPLAQLLHSCEAFPKWHWQKTPVASGQRWIGAWRLYKGKMCTEKWHQSV